MKSSLIKKTLQYVLSFALAGGLMWYVYKDVDTDALYKELKNVNMFWVGVSFIPMLISHVARARRWNLLLEPMGFKSTVVDSFLALLAGYFANSFIPRMGEVTRCVALKRMHNVSLTNALGTVVTDRIMDLIVLALITLLSMTIEFDKITGFLLPLLQGKANNSTTATPGYGIWIVVFSIVLFGVLLYLLYRNRSHFAKIALVKKIWAFALNMLTGLTSFKKIKSPKEFIMQTVIIWMGYLLTVYLIFKALPPMANLGVEAALVILVFGSLGMAAPTQNGIGPYHFMVTGGLMLYGLPDIDAKTGALLLHSTQLFGTLFFGGLATAFIFLKKPKYPNSKN